MLWECVTGFMFPVNCPSSQGSDFLWIFDMDLFLHTAHRELFVIAQRVHTDQTMATKFGLFCWFLFCLVTFWFINITAISFILLPL